MGRPRIALVCSSGGHLAHLLVLQPWWIEHDRFWVTFDKPDARSVLSDERVYWCHHPANRNVRNLVRNARVAFHAVRRERPTLIVSTGAGPAVPSFYIGKNLFGARTVYLEVIDVAGRPSLTGRLIRFATDRYFVQRPEQLPLYRDAELIGPLF